MWRGSGHDDSALDGTLVSQAYIALSEVPKPAVNQLAGPPGCPERQVVGLDQDNRQPTGSGVQSDAGSGDPAADHQDVTHGTGGGLHVVSPAAGVQRGVHLTSSAPSSSRASSNSRASLSTSDVAGRSE